MIYERKTFVMPKLSPPTAHPALLPFPAQQASLATSVAPATSDPTFADVATSDVGNGGGAQISDRTAPPTDEKNHQAEEGAQVESAVVAAPAPAGEEMTRAEEPLENSAPAQDTEVVAVSQEAKAAADTEATAMVHGTPTVETEAMVAAMPGVPETAEAAASAMAHCTPQDWTQDLEREECEKLINMRAEKLRLIKGN